MADLPKHPLERKQNCPVCQVPFQSIPLRRGTSPDETQHIVEQHVCPTGHVYLTEIGSDVMLAD